MHPPPPVMNIHHFLSDTGLPSSFLPHLPGLCGWKAVFGQLLLGGRAFGEWRGWANGDFGVVWVQAGFAMPAVCRDLGFSVNLLFQLVLVPHNFKKGIYLAPTPSLLLTHTHMYVILHEAQYWVATQHPGSTLSPGMTSRQQWKHKSLH